MAWTYFFNITNGTDRDLKVHKKDLKWGTWYTGSTDDSEPVGVAVGQTVEAVGVRAGRGTWTGYEFSVTWSDVHDAKDSSYGTLHLRVDVPFSGKNSSEFTVGGAYQQDGWASIPEHDESDECSVTITVGPDKRLKALKSTRTPAAGNTAVAALEQEYRDYLLAYAAANPDVRDWEAVSGTLGVVDSFVPQLYLPEKIDLTKKMVARSAPQEVAHRLWEGIGDPDLPNHYAKDLFAARYFSVAVYTVTTNPRDILSMARGETRKFSERVEITSAIKNVLTTTQSINSSVSATASSPALGAEVASTLEMAFSVENVREESRQVVKERIEEVTYTAPDDHDLQIVPWVFSTAVLIYREDKKGRVNLIAASDWAQVQLYRSYLT